MTYGESIARVVERQCAALRELAPAFGSAAGAAEGDAGWDAREILLHLLGATREMPADMAGTSEVVVSGQTGGTYNDVPELASALEVCAALVRQLEHIADVARGVADAALSRMAFVGDGAGGRIEAPMGLVVRHGLTEHFDEHLVQLRELLTS